jgi:hypothetical protein
MSRRGVEMLLPVITLTSNLPSRSASSANSGMSINEQKRSCRNPLTLTSNSVDYSVPIRKRPTAASVPTTMSRRRVALEAVDVEAALKQRR